MRERCLSEICDAWYNVITTYSQPGHENLELVDLSLDGLSRYIDWIDINFVANDRFLPLIYSRSVFYAFIQSYHKIASLVWLFKYLVQFINVIMSI